MQIQNFPDGTPTVNDLLLFQSITDGTYRKATFNQISGNSQWNAVNSNYLASSGEKIRVDSAGITITLPDGTIGEVEIFNSSGTTYINTQGEPYNGIVHQPSNLVLQGENAYIKLLYINESIGWYPLSGTLDTIGIFASGMSLLMEGTLNDTSGNNRVITPTVNNPLLTTGFDNQPTIRFTETSVQELSVTPFLSGTSGATLYIVFSPNNDNQYNLIKTANIDDYWRFSGNEAGYFGTFRSGRFEAYPLNMPSSGNHLISIHSTNNNYEVIQNNTSKGVRTDNTYSPGDRFIIASDDKRYIGDISFILVYPFYIAPSSTSHLSNIQTVKDRFPSLPFTL